MCAFKPIYSIVSGVKMMYDVIGLSGPVPLPSDVHYLTTSSSPVRTNNNSATLLLRLCVTVTWVGSCNDAPWVDHADR